MFNNYLKIAYRNLSRNKGYSLINIFGLAVGMACCLLIYIYVSHELSFDKFHKNSDRIYRVLHGYFPGEEKVPENISPEDLQVWGNAPVAPALQDFYPEIESVVRFTSPFKLLISNGETSFQENNVIFMDSTAFDLFNWELIAGNKNKALTGINNVVLTESVALKYFGTTDIVGRTLTVDDEEDVMITGVIRDVPSNSQLNFDILVSMMSFKTSRPQIFDSWDYVDFYTYFRLASATEIEDLRSRIPEFLRRNVNKDMRYALDLEPMEGAYLTSKAGRQPGPVGNLNNIYIFSSIAVFILLIACINFMNLSTARSLERAREVGVRKSLGALRGSLLRQFLVEALIISSIATFIALMLAEFALPFISAVSGKELLNDNLRSPKLYLLSFGLSILTGLLAGSYPALILSSYKPVNVLKGSFSRSESGHFIRKGLVVFQFSLSIILIAGTFIIFSQLQHLKTKDLGFDKEQMLVIDFGYDDKVQKKINVIRNQLLNHPDVISATVSRAVPGGELPGAYTRIEGPDGTTVHRNPLIYEVDPVFFNHFNIEFVAGRPFSTEISSDSTEALIVNKAAAEMYGYNNPEEIIGKRFDQWGRTGVIVGVTENFHYQSLHREIQPLSMRFAHRSSTQRFTLKVASTDYSQTIKELEQEWKKAVPHYPFVYSFLDQDLETQYDAEKRFGNLFLLFAGLAIIIACLGLFGLSTYSIEQRTKEIGVRKILGASMSKIVSILSLDFIKLVIVANIIAIPVCWFVMERWLEGFIFHTTINPLVFLYAGLATLVITMITISRQSIKAAIKNPVESLRQE